MIDGQMGRGGKRQGEEGRPKVSLWRTRARPTLDGGGIGWAEIDARPEVGSRKEEGELPLTRLMLLQSSERYNRTTNTL